MAKKPKRLLPQADWTPTADLKAVRLDHLEMAKVKLQSSFQNETRTFLSIKEAMELLCIQRTRFHELVNEGFIGVLKDGRNTRVIVHSCYVYLLRLVDAQIEAEEGE